MKSNSAYGVSQKATANKTMPLPPDIKLEDDPSPAVLMMANWLRLALASSNTTVPTATFAVISPRGPSVSVTMRPDIIRLEGALSPEARLFFHLDFNHLGDPAHEPVVKDEDAAQAPGKTILSSLADAWLRRRLARILALPFPHWQAGAKRFWAAAASLPDIPKSLWVTSSDEAQTLSLGEGEGEGEAEAKITGTSLVLARLFAGHRLLSQESYFGRLHCQVSLQHLAGLSNAGLELRLGFGQMPRADNLLKALP